MTKINWKSRTTWTGISGLVAAIGGYFTGEATAAAAVAGALASLAVIFGRAALPAATAVLALVILGGCQTLPMEQNAKDEAGRSEVTQSTQTWQNDYRSFLPSTMKIEGDFNLTIYANGSERSSDVSVTNSGSTTATQAATQTGTQTPTSTPTVDTNVSGLPGQ